MSKPSLLLGGAIGLFLSVGAMTAAYAGAPSATVAYQPMVSAGLTAERPFEAWFVLDKSSDPKVPGYAIPAGAEIRFVFPKEFTPRTDLFQGAVMLPGSVQDRTPLNAGSRYNLV